MPRWVATIALALLAQTESQAQRPAALSPEEVQRLETAVQRNPNDTAARSRLLDHYYLDRSVDPTEAIAARRRHILWLIENAPESALAGTSQATIDPSGYSLGDAQGYKLASEAWRRQAANPDVKPAVLMNAAFFFKTLEQQYTVSLLERALSLDPKNKEIGARLGDEYALIILGVTLLNRNGYPLRADRGLAQSALANTARNALTTSRNPYALAKAGYMLAWQGIIVYASGQIPFNPMPLARSAVDRAVSLAPGDPQVAAAREQVREFERMAQAATRTQKDAPPTPHVSAQTPGHSTASPSAASPQAAVPALAADAAPAPSTPAKEDLAKITVGMSREDVLKLGPPASRTTMDDGHLTEIFQYFVNTSTVGTIRLRDGVVTNVQIP
ncbi:MAG TPA: hypothetical protein VMH05_26115 [Bryobacteraceae bacterium]|nr:hypothetical protein [Bryobacteraceae bacterium]